MRRTLVRVLVAAALVSLAACSRGPYDAKGVAAAPAAQVMRLNLDLKAEEKFNTDSFAAIEEQGFRRVADEPLSTFSSDVDTASYSIVRRMITEGSRPPAGAVRIEEMLNYFTYAYEPPAGDEPFAVHAETAACPWALDHRLLRIGVKAREVRFLAKQPVNLVFLLDVSGSMAPADRLPLVLESMKLLVDSLAGDDRVAIVVYAGAAGMVLPPTPCDRKTEILEALSRLSAGGSTNGGAGIELAYRTAKESFVEHGVNRVILATDGDFNVGVSSRSELVRMVEERAKEGVWLSVLGVGRGNLKDDTMEQLADRGNGNYAYLDSIAEGRRALVEQAGGTLVTVAKDVKFQVEFNPAEVEAYRLIGYENRVLANQDFNDDKKDAGDVGAGHCVTALYEVVPAGGKAEAAPVDPLKYQTKGDASPAAASGEMCTLKVRWKDPEAARSRLLETAVRDSHAAYSQASPDFKFASAVASFGMLLRGSKFAGTASLDAVLELAQEGIGADPGGYRHEFVGLVRQAKSLPPN